MKTPHQKLWDAVKTVLRGKLDLLLRKVSTQRSKILPWKIFEKEKQSKLKISIVIKLKIRAEIIEIENQKSMKPLKTFKKVNKTDRPLARPI